MEKRKAKVNISAAGGTAGKGAKTYKVSLPTSWMNTLKINQEEREIELRFDGTKITLSRCLTGAEFAAQKRTLGHEIRLLRFF